MMELPQSKAIKNYGVGMKYHAGFIPALVFHLIANNVTGLALAGAIQGTRESEVTCVSRSESYSYILKA
jgi:hypothetical protein